MNAQATCSPLFVKRVLSACLLHRHSLRHSIPIARAIRRNRDMAPLRALRILVVGEDQRAMDELGRLTRRRGYTTCKRFDDLADSSLAETLRPRVVLLNIGRHFLVACKAARELRLCNRREECLMIGLAPRSSDMVRWQCRESGIDLLLVGPFDEEAIDTLLLMEWTLLNRPRVSTAAIGRYRRHEQRIASR